MATVEVPLQVFRYKAGQRPHYDSFRVRVADTASVLDVIDTVWAEKDHSLTFRRACHHASCGACALRINGVEKLPASRGWPTRGTAAHRCAWIRYATYRSSAILSWTYAVCSDVCRPPRWT